MIKRLVSISNPAEIRLLHKQLIVKQGGKVDTIPIEDLGVLVLENREILITSALFSFLAENECVVVFCDKTHHPNGIFLPLFAHTTTSKNIHLQIKTSEPNKKRLWEKIVCEKTTNQMKLLKKFAKKTDDIKFLISNIKSGDTENIEGQVARKYWKRLFGENFLREQKSADLVNICLNYGYGILRACIARSVVGAGLNTNLGVHHCNQYNNFNLVDDLMEPFRPLIDELVCKIIFQENFREIFNTEHKRKLLELMTINLTWNKKITPIFSCFIFYVASFREGLENYKKLKFPKY